MTTEMVYLIVILIMSALISTATAAKTSSQGQTSSEINLKDEVKQRLRSRQIPTPVTNNLFISPAGGTDVLTHPIAVIKCANQTQCVQPKLQLTQVYDVYFCKHVGYGVRFYFLAKEGLLLHPNIRMVDDINAAQMIVYLPESSPWHKSECSLPEYKNRTVVLDEGDGPDRV